MLYGFPALDGAKGGLKVATEQYDNTVRPDSVPRDVSEESVAAMHAEYIAPRFPDLGSHCLRTATCLYTVTPNAKFVIDYADASHNVIFASACSGHGFKHSPAVGESLAQLGVDTVSRVSQHHAAVQVCRDRRTDLLQRDLRLGLKRNLFGYFRLFPPLGILGPFLG